MPCYPYTCDCGHKTDIFKPMSQYRDLELCPICGVEMQRDFTGGCASTDVAFNKPIEMFSVAPRNLSELSRLREKLPETKFTDQMVPIAHNRAEKLRILRALDCEEKA